MKPELEATPKLGFGCMRLPLLDPADQQSIDLEQFKQMVDVFMEGGGTYFDTAFVYHEGASERALKRSAGEALSARRIHGGHQVPGLGHRQQGRGAEQPGHVACNAWGIDYVDFYLLHNVGGARTAKFDEYGMWDFVKQKKEDGRVRHWGFSLHDGPEALDALLDAHPDADFVQLQANYSGLGRPGHPGAPLHGGGAAPWRAGGHHGAGTRRPLGGVARTCGRAAAKPPLPT